MPERVLNEMPERLVDFQIQVEEDLLDDISAWLRTEVQTAEADRSELQDKVIEYDRLYRAEPKVTKKDFPWEGASNLTVPVVSTAVDAIVARIMNSLFGTNELWVGMPKSGEWADIATDIGNFLNWAGENVMDMYHVMQRLIIATVKHGTGVLKLPWEQRNRRARFMTREGGIREEEFQIHNGPMPSVIPIDQFLFSSDALSTRDIQRCSWVGHPVYYTWKELKELESSGVFTGVQRLEDWKRSIRTQREQETDKAVGVQPTERNDYEVHEIWCSYPTEEGSDVLSELIVNIHIETGTILRAVYNFYRHQERSFHIIRYMPQDNSLYGIGIAEMLKDVQEEITVIHNQRIDNATTANMKVFKRLKGSSVSDIDIYPGAIVDVDNMEDITPMDLGTAHTTMLVEEQHTNAIGERRTGVSDYTVGRESSAIGSRATATSTLALIREGNKRFQMTIRDLRESLGAIAHQTLMLYQQFAPESRVTYEMFSPEKGMRVRKFLDLPGDLTKENIHIDIPALSETANKEILQQTMMTMMQVVRDFYGSMFEAVGVAINPEAPQPIRDLAIQGAKTGAEIFERMLEAFDFRDAETFKPDIEKLLQLQAGLEQMQGDDMGQLRGEQDATTANGQRAEPAPGSPGGGQEPDMANTISRVEQQILEATEGGIR